MAPSNDDDEWLASMDGVDGVDGWRREAVATICAEFESAYENHETGKQNRLLRELGVNLRDDDHSGIEAITPEACRQHFLKISGEPNEPLS